MCGIWASWGIEASRQSIDIVAHRGPDGEGWQHFDLPSGRLYLGHRRLAIIDLSAQAAQPMSDPSGRWHVVYNGEIYNHIELRTELTAMGHVFRGQSDTEILLAAFAQWGEACLDRFNGMFAFALWDSQQGRLFAARDRFGVKPLYWWTDGRALAVASEIKQFLTIPGFTARLDPVSAHDFLGFGVFDHSAATFLRGVHQVQGGHCLSLTPGQPPSLRRWYSLPQAGSRPLPEHAAVAAMRDLLTDSVRLRLRADVPVGTCLSGGLDSSSIVCLAAASGLAQPAAISACYSDPKLDERPFIHKVVAATGAKSIEIFPDGAELPDLLEQMVWHQDGPISSTSAFAQWCVFRAARKAGIPVMLDGQGADEQLGGYHTAYGALHAGLLRSGRWLQLNAALSAQRSRHDISAPRQWTALAGSLLRPLAHRLLGQTRPDWLAPALSGHHPPLPANIGLSALMVSQLTKTSLPMLLHYEDRNSMAHGIEARLPFLDYRLVETLVGLGDHFKIVDGETKWVLRRAMTHILPDTIRDRQDKIGFATPQQAWLAGPARSILDRGLTEAAQTVFAFAAKPMERLRNEVLAGQRPIDDAVWRIVSFSMFLRRFQVSA